MDALVQRREFSKSALSSAFYCLLAVGTVLATIFVLGANVAAQIAGEPALAQILPPLSITLLFMPAIAVMDALIISRLQFRLQALRSMAGVLVGGAAGLIVAFGPSSEWALVAQRVIGLVAVIAVLFVFTRWVPGLTFDVSHAKGFLRRATQLWTTTVLATMHWRITQLSVGIRAGGEALGLLNVAQRFETALHGPVTGPIQTIWVPVLSMLRSDRATSWQLFLRLTQVTALFALPAFVGLGLVGRDVVTVTLDERYRLAGDILLVVGMQGLIIPLGFFSNLIFAGFDRSDLSLKFSLAQLSITGPAVWFAASGGPVVAQIVALTSMGAWGLVATGVQVRMLGGQLPELIKAIAPAYLAGLAMTATVLALRYLLPLPEGLARLVCLVLAGTAVYVGWILLFHRKAVFDAWQLMSSIRAEGPGSAIPVSQPSG
jgi:O-antigen/teichoic acid export membrane protein